MKKPAKKPVPEAVERRVPTQERAKRRYAAILEAAAHVFAEAGYEAATMDDIAARAETSIGSIYQFFPNKTALFHALARHYHAKLRGFFDGLLSGPLLEGSWTDILDSGIDALLAFHVHEPGFRAVWVGLHLTDEVVTEGEAINRDLALRIAAILARKLPRLPEEERAVVATLMVETLTAVIIAGVRRPAEAEPLMAATKVMLRRYLAPYEEDAAAPRRAAARAAVRSSR
jgi:AcrR family transcriptional regulator